jgi:hypothetical protein
MASNTGIDLMRGRPTPGIASTEEQIQRRQLDSLKRGIHRIDDKSAIPYRIHLVTSITSRTNAPHVVSPTC